MPQFGLNRLDYRSPHHFADDAQRAEQLGWDWAFIPDSQLNLPDPYVMLATAAQSTERIGLGVLVTNPVIRDVTATAASAATLESLAPGGRSSASAWATPPFSSLGSGHPVSRS